MGELLKRFRAEGGGSSSIRELVERRRLGFGFLQSFFSKWLKVDLTTLAVILTLFGAISSGTQQVRAIALSVYRWITRFFTASVSIQGSDRLNREVLNWIGAHVLLQQETRILTARSEPIQNDAMHFGRGLVKRIDYFHEKRLPIQYLPTFGITWFFHNRNVFLVRRIPDGRSSREGALATEMPDQYVVPPAGNEPLVVMCLGRSVAPIKKFLDVCRDFADKQRESFTTVRAARNQYHRESWDTTILRPIRPLETVHMDMKVKDELVSDIENYLKHSTRRFYTSRGIPYRRGYLLHGPPGTGKTSLSLALAGRFGLELYILHLPSLNADGELERLFTVLPPQCIVLLEDIDAVGVKRRVVEADKDEDGTKMFSNVRSGGVGRVSLSGLLNVLDGVTSQEGRIVLMTSNMADKLDEALVRPGRIDKMIFLGHIYQQAAEEMFLRMYAPDANEEPNLAETCTVEVGEEELKKLASEFSTKVPDDTFTPAQLQGYLLNHRNRPARAVEDIIAWVQEEQVRMEQSKKHEAEMAALEAKRNKGRLAQQNHKLAAIVAVERGGSSELGFISQPGAGPGDFPPLHESASMPASSGVGTAVTQGGDETEEAQDGGNHRRTENSPGLEKVGTDVETDQAASQDSAVDGEARP
ncbi:P-loop containing nucleoside triphosphate hydrolase protein [Pseudomassariella vexata]|uniref:p-loop containing nucleoside triphosphate hydrolase protein n=1 Tax=Pseudomassariella vexata TaxID=1141098 RepID=A0A1Y2EFL6_9PEZI|nr:P-loop containing nucleoside triphosphate hydrolase protein [Pseudomassariella vexata]ORY70349.1 P-loop containing nucleoside triphosphate hydrolase protein [Pseudomassariella vexata]